MKSYVEDNLPVAAARILEVGCGQGDLARELAASGHDVVAIDPDAPEGELFQAVSLEAFAEDGRFDAVVASRAVHHIPDLPCAVAKVARLLRPGGRFILDEHACDRLDEKAALWYLLPPQAREQGALAS
jgi:2-polyprenyl-3-methyl-5-hydroxy-6-metoxy-1,4-benzoquinol methylase